MWAQPRAAAAQALELVPEGPAITVGHHVAMLGLRFLLTWNRCRGSGWGAFCGTSVGGGAGPGPGTCSQGVSWAP